MNVIPELPNIPDISNINQDDLDIQLNLEVNQEVNEQEIQYGFFSPTQALLSGIYLYATPSGTIIPVSEIGPTLDYNWIDGIQVGIVTEWRATIWLGADNENCGYLSIMAWDERYIIPEYNQFLNLTSHDDVFNLFFNAFEFNTEIINNDEFEENIIPNNEHPDNIIPNNQNPDDFIDDNPDDIIPNNQNPDDFIDENPDHEHEQIQIPDDERDDERDDEPDIIAIPHN